MLTFLLWGCGGSNNTTMENLSLDRYEAEIRAFEQENHEQGAPKGALVFLGDARLRSWPGLAGNFPGFPLKNRAFGQATLREINHYYRRLLDPFQAELVVIYAGEHDILLGARAEEVQQSMEDFLRLMAASHRATRIIYVSILPSPARWEQWPEFQRANALIRQMAEANSRMEFLDLSPELLDGEGRSIPQLYEPDGLALNATGYARWAAALGPLLEQMF